MTRLVVPITGIVSVISLALILLLVMIVRPWAGPDTSWRTHLNQTDQMIEGYSRTVQSSVGPPAPIQIWHTASDQSSDREMFYVGKGCAFCHGLEGQGGVVGPPLKELTRSDIQKALRKGPEGMPPVASEAAVLSADEADAMIAFLMARQSENSAKGAGSSSQPPPAAKPPAAAPVAREVPTATPAPEPTPTVVVADESKSEAVPTQEPASTGQQPTETPTSAGQPAQSTGPISLTAATKTISVDGDTSDWSDITPTSVTLEQIGRKPGDDFVDVKPVNADLRVAVDDERLYVLLEVFDDYDYVADDHGLSAAAAVMFRIDQPAEPHMGTNGENRRHSMGKVDIWHWELDCGPGIVSGGVTGISGGNDPKCNLDDEYAKTPKDLEDDGSRSAENSLTGVWNHTARSQGKGADGAWIFEISRKLQTGDPDDAQFSRGSTTQMALAYWDADETPDGWTASGHLQSANGGWINVELP